MSRVTVLGHLFRAAKGGVEHSLFVIIILSACLHPWWWFLPHVPLHLQGGARRVPVCRTFHLHHDARHILIRYTLKAIIYVSLRFSKCYNVLPEVLKMLHMYPLSFTNNTCTLSILQKLHMIPLSLSLARM